MKLMSMIWKRIQQSNTNAINRGWIILKIIIRVFCWFIELMKKQILVILGKLLRSRKKDFWSEYLK